MPMTKMDGESGGTLIEMALVLPAFLMLVLGLVNFAETMFEYSNVTYACRTAARYASLHSTSSTVPCNTTCVQNIVTPLLYLPSYATPSVATTYGSGNTVGSTVKVAVTVNSYISIPFISIHAVSVGSSAQRTISR